MPSYPHEGLLQLFRSRPSLAAELLQSALHVELPGYTEARIHSAIGVTGAIYAMRRELWAALPQGLILDDLYAPMQVVLRGYRVGFCDAAIATDARRFTPKDEYRRKARTLTGVLQLCAWLPSVLSP